MLLCYTSDVKVATEHVGYAHLAGVFTAVTGKPARYEKITRDQALAKPGLYHADDKLGAEYESENDDTLMTVMENFSAFWRIFQRSADNKGVLQRDYEMLDRILPGRARSIREWMEKTGYVGEHKLLLGNGGK